MKIALSHLALLGIAFIGTPTMGLAADPGSAYSISSLMDRSDPGRPIISLVSPQTLFPIEGLTFKDTYRPLTVYDKPTGSPVGEVIVTNARCAGADVGPDCQEAGPWELRLADGTRFKVEVGEYSYSAYGLVSYSQSTPAPNGAWSEISTTKGPLWVLTPQEAVISYESLVHVVENFDRWCEMPGSCKPVSRSMSEEMRRVADGEVKLSTCYPQAYEVTGIVTAEGVNYYQVALAEIEPGSSVPQLPKSGFVPTRNLNGSHTGTFYARGC